MTKITAKLSYLRIAPRKARLLVDLIRGMSLKEAEYQLKFSLKKAALPILKLLKSAEGNAKHNFKKDSENLYVKEIRLDKGPILKRWRPRARGRATMIRRRTSHVFIALGDKTESEK